MGLMYIFPTNEEETDHVEVKNQEITLKTYGLPLLFWGYMAAALIVLASMWLASKDALNKLISYPDAGLVALGILVKYTLLFSPIVMLGFFFYEKQIRKSKTTLSLVYRLFYFPVFKKTYELDSSDALSVDHFMDSPNMAKIYNKKELKAFENKGYFELHALSLGKTILIDRHSRKADLLKIKTILEKY